MSVLCKKMDIFEKRFLMPQLQYVDERELDDDRNYLVTMYPAKARLIMVMIEEECDRLEYEGSPMLVMYPDKESLLAIARKICNKVSCEDDEALRQLIEVMVCNEFMFRRSRYKRRRRFF